MIETKTLTRLFIFSSFPVIALIYIAASCEPKEPTPCEPVTIYHLANLDSALQHYAPHTNLQVDTANLRELNRILEYQVLAVTDENGKLRMRLTKAAQDIAGMNQQLKYCKCSPLKPDSTFANNTP